MERKGTGGEGKGRKERGRTSGPPKKFPSYATSWRCEHLLNAIDDTHTQR